MSNTWMVVALTSAAATLGRELLGVVRDRLRRISIERLATRMALPGSHLVDQDGRGARLELTIGRLQPQPPTGDADSDHKGTG